MTPEIRYYKGKYRVEIVLKSKLNYRVKALEFIPTKHDENGVLTDWICAWDEFTTVPRLLWRHPRK